MHVCMICYFRGCYGTILNDDVGREATTAFKINMARGRFITQQFVVPMCCKFLIND